MTESRCAFCGASEPSFVVSTGVSAYESCYMCYAEWMMSDRTIEALNEVRAYGARARERREARQTV